MIYWDTDADLKDRANKDVLLDRRMMALAMYGAQEGWTTFKRLAVAKYMRKVLLPLTPGEVAMMLPFSLQEVIDRAAVGYDAYQGRRARVR